MKFFQGNQSTFLAVVSIFLSVTGDYADDKKVLVKFERYGGFAGFHDDLTIFEDFTYQLGTPQHVKHYFRGQISFEHQKKLGKLLGEFGKFLKEYSNGPGVADGMSVRMEVNGSAGDKGAKGDKAALDLLLDQIMTEAQKGKPVLK